MRHPVLPDAGARRFVIRCLLGWYRAAARDLPWRRTLDPYGIWVAEVMLQQTQVRTVISYWERWMREFPSVGALAQASPERVLKLWEGLGYYSRARNLQKAAQLIVNSFEGRFPSIPEQVMQLPGVGRYTLGAVSSIAFGLPLAAVDGNVARVLARFCGVRTPIKERPALEMVWRVAQDFVADATTELDDSVDLARVRELTARHRAGDFNEALIELGATVCTPKSPNCEVCPIRPGCFADRHGCSGELPVAASRVRMTRQRYLALVLWNVDGRVLIRRRSDQEVNGGLWEFPNLLVARTQTETLEALSLELGIEINRSPAPLLRVEHSITRFRITLKVFELRRVGRRGTRRRTEQWVKLEEADALPFSAAHRKVLNHLMCEPRSIKSSTELTP